MKAIAALLAAFLVIGCASQIDEASRRAPEGLDELPEQDIIQTDDSEKPGENAGKPVEYSSNGQDALPDKASLDFALQYCTEGAKVLICGTVVKVMYDSPGKSTEYYREGEILSFSCPVIGMHDMSDECKAMMGENCGDNICRQ